MPTLWQRSGGAAGAEECPENPTVGISRVRSRGDSPRAPRDRTHAGCSAVPGGARAARGRWRHGAGRPRAAVPSANGAGSLRAGVGERCLGGQRGDIPPHRPFLPRVEVSGELGVGVRSSFFCGRAAGTAGPCCGGVPRRHRVRLPVSLWGAELPQRCSSNLLVKGA